MQNTVKLHVFAMFFLYMLAIYVFAIADFYFLEFLLFFEFL